MIKNINLHKDALKIFFYTIERKSLVYIFLFQIFTISVLDMFSLGLLFPYLQFIAKDTESFASLNSIHAQDLNKVTFFCFLAISSAFILRFLLTKRVVRFAYTQEKHLSDFVIASVLNFPLEKFAELKDANIYRLVATEIPQAVNAYFVGLVYMSSGALSALLIVLLMLAVNPSLALYSMVVLAGFYLLIYLIVAKKLDKLGIQRLQLNERKFNMFSASLASYKDIRIGRTRPKIISEYKQTSSAYAEVHSSIQFAAVSPKYLVEFMLSIVILGASYSYANGFDGPINLTDLMFFAVAGSRLLPIMQIIYARLAAVKYSLPTVINVKNQLDDFMGYNKEIEVNRAISSTISRREPKVKSIEIEGIRFNYLKSDTEICFSNHAFKIGSVNLVTGKTGAGKTTLLNIIAGLLPANGGNVKVNGEVSELYENDEWFSRISYVDQFPYLVEGSIKENIFQDVLAVTREDFLNIAKRVGLSKTLQEESRVAEGGKNLSGGQRQKVAFARAVVNEKDVCIFDEITSGIDQNSRLLIANVIEELAKQRLVIVVTHDKFLMDRFPNQIFNVNDRRE
jgi:ATP-binding cassette, subfamily B, bacterial PglK